MADPMYHWKLMEQADPELNEKTKQLRSQICAHGAIPKKYVELMRVAMAAMVRSVPTERAHIQHAIKNGATKEEVFEVLSLVLMWAGVPAYREVCLNLEDILEPFFSDAKGA